MTGARTLLLLLTAVNTGAWAAQPPAPVTAPAQPPSAEQAAGQPSPTPTLGRMFFTAGERSSLDQMRRRPTVAPAPEAVPPPPMPEYVTLNGVVRRSDGTTTVWLNDKPVQGQRSAEGLVIAPARANAPGNVTLRVPQTGRSVNLKVGQQLEVTSGQVQEGYRAPAPTTSAAPATAAAAESSAERPAAQRRPSRDRELLRELLREIDTPAASEPARESAEPAGTPGQ
jgi:hypothetical protein